VRRGRGRTQEERAERWTSQPRSKRYADVSIIGCDAANGTYFQLYSDERGMCRVYEMSIGNGEWKLWRRAGT
jgi:hypothetical protein